MLFTDVLDYLFPNHCLGCGIVIAGHEVVCNQCETRLPMHQTFFCATCEAPLATLEQSCHATATYRLGAASVYDHALVQELIHALKFDGARSAAVPLGALLARYVERLQLHLGNPLVVPIPLHAERQRLRGFNQSELVANVFANRCSYEMVPHVLTRTRNTSPQHELSREDRLRNLTDCFAVRSPIVIMDRVVVLIDDVTTSGATFREATRALLDSGARSVVALAIAKAQLCYNTNNTHHDALHDSLAGS